MEEEFDEEAGEHMEEEFDEPSDLEPAAAAEPEAEEEADELPEPVVVAAESEDEQSEVGTPMSKTPVASPAGAAMAPLIPAIPEAEEPPETPRKEAPLEVEGFLPVLTQENAADWALRSLRPITPP